MFHEKSMHNPKNNERDRKHEKDDIKPVPSSLKSLLSLKSLQSL